MSTLAFDDPALVARRARIARSLELGDALLLVAAGEPIGIPGGQDRTYPFLAHAEYVALADRNEPGGVVAYDPREGDEGWRDFAPAVTEEERVWEGREHAPGTPLGELAGWLAARRGRAIAALGAALPGLRGDDASTLAVRERLTHARRPKDEVEIARMRRAAAATAAGFAAARDLLAARGPKGATERAMQVEIDAAFARHGADRPGYDTIVGFAERAAILHVAPSTRRAADNELILIDAGAELDRYCVDVTRTIGTPALDAARRELQRIVLRAMRNAIAGCVVGAEWTDLHLGAARDMAEGLIGMGVLRGSADDAVASGATELFFPHGLGHLVGLGVRDASGRLPGRAPRRRPGIATIRCDFPLEAGYAITVEPGCYFIPALLADPERRRRHADRVDWRIVDALVADRIGGVRMEDTIVVTAQGPENLTAAIPTDL